MFKSGLAVKYVFVRKLDARLADVEGSRVVISSAAFFKSRLISLRDSADITDNVCCVLSGRVEAMHTGPHLNSREAPCLGGKPRHFFVGQITFNRSRAQTRQFVLQPIETANVSFGNGDNLLKLFDRLVEVRRLGRRNFQCIDRIIRS